MKEHEVIKLDDDKFLVDNKPAKKATLEDMVSKAKEELRKQKKRSTNKKVENNK
jgi:hypothetical protein